jgi:ubiquinone/menaquinone biosynthesis C-methylase UbiE
MSLNTIDFERLALRPGQRVLDLGCGEGRHAIGACLSGAVHVVGLDLSARDLGTARERFADFEPQPDDRSLAWVRGSGLSLPFADAAFDVVICAEVLEHVPDFQQVLTEIQRVLKPGGLLALSVPRFVPEWVCWQLSSDYHQVEGGHVRIFRARALERAVGSRRMYRYARHWSHALHVPYWWLRCLFWRRGADFWPVRTYHRLLVWDLMRQPRLTRWLDRLLNPLLGKSLVLYFVRGAE